MTPMPALPPRGGPTPSVRAARAAVSVLFLVKGATIASVVPRLPEIKDALGLSNAELGTAVAALPIGGLIAGGFAGLLIHRIGSGRLAVMAGVAGALLLGAVGLATSWATLAAVYLVFGMLDATMDAAMNAHGVAVQRRYGRSIMHGFHGWWSGGTMVAGAVGVAAAALVVPVATDLALVGIALAVTTLVAWRWLLPDHEADAPEPGVSAPAPIRTRDLGPLMRVLGPIALLGVLSVMIQDAASTWSPIYLVNTLGLGAAIGASAFVLYTATMTLGRLTNDRWIDRWGDVTVVRAGAVLAAGGLVAVSAAGSVGVAAVAFIGFAVVGFGVAPMAPAMFASAGSRPGIATGHGVGVVNWLLRTGLVISPVLVGLVADARGLAAAFIVPLIAAILVATLASWMLGRGRGGQVGPAAGPSS